MKQQVIHVTGVELGSHENGGKGGKDWTGKKNGENGENGDMEIEHTEEMYVFSYCMYFSNNELSACSELLAFVTLQTCRIFIKDNIMMGCEIKCNDSADAILASDRCHYLSRILGHHGHVAIFFRCNV